jgi:hypothetical protein
MKTMMKKQKHIGKMSKAQRKAHKATSRRRHGGWMAKLQSYTNHSIGLLHW